MTDRPVDRADPTAPGPDLDALARLARLELDPAHREPSRARLTKVLDAFAALRSIDTSAVRGADPTAAANPAASDPTAADPTAADPTASTPARLPLRPDLVGDALPLDVLLGGAAHTAADCFLVPRVVDG